jgi:hypothetical protein
MTNETQSREADADLKKSEAKAKPTPITDAPDWDVTGGLTLADLPAG